MDSNFLDVLDDMTFNAVYTSDNSSKQAIQKWTALGYTHAEAETALANINQSKKVSQRFTPSELRQTIGIPSRSRRKGPSGCGLGLRTRHQGGQV
jgi:hypothetical protein